MSELSDWIWLAVVVLWLVMRIVPRLFGARVRSQEAPATEPAEWRPAAGWTPTGAGEEQLVDIGPKPIHPK